MSNILYLAVALVLGGVFLFHCVRMLKDRDQAPIQTFRFSIVYLMLLFIGLVVDHYMLPVNYV